MKSGQKIGVVIPALNEERAIGKVIAAIPRWVDQIIVADNGSRDDTANVARTAGAHVVHEPRRGYGAACQAALAEMEPCDITVFLDGDNSDYPDDMAALVEPIAADRADLVIGSRTTGIRLDGSLTPQQRCGNALACLLIRLIWGVHYTDLGPFRAIRTTTLQDLNMADRNFGWTVEMQINAITAGYRGLEVPVRYRPRIGQSKISGTIKGTLLASWTILKIIFLSAVRRNWQQT